MLRISKNIKRIIQWDVKCELPSVCQALSLSSVPRNSFSDDLTLSDFMGSTPVRQTKNEKITKSTAHGNRTVFVETYGCQMNVNDSEVVRTVLDMAGGYSVAPSAEEADVVLLNTCAIRENAESKIWQRLGYFKNMKLERRKRHRFEEGKWGPVVGVLGCMAERLKHKLLEGDRLVDLVVGPDAYRDLPNLIEIVSPSGIRKEESASTAINVQLSVEETYADIIPVRHSSEHSVFLSIMRGCNNMCSFCVVPYTRGRERSRPVSSIIDEIRYLSDTGVKEVTLLGQNVNSYADFSDQEQRPFRPQGHVDYFEENYARGFRSVYKPIRDGSVSFAELLDLVASVDPEMRIRFTSPHPKDFSDDVLKSIKDHHNICYQLHMPAQSGSTEVLSRMRRGYTREAYDDLVLHIRESLPGVALSTDMIAGFCGETEEDHQLSVDLMRQVRYDLAFLFAYSSRDKTHAARHHIDDIPASVKTRRLQELITEYRSGLEKAALEEVGRRHIVLIEGASKRSEEQLTGRTDSFKRVILDDIKVPAKYKIHFRESTHGEDLVPIKPGDYVAVQIVNGGKGATLFAKPLARTTISEFVGEHGSALPLCKFDSID